MSSQALYRKWRSQNFDDLVGQAHIVQALRNAIASGRVGHAYLFTGPRGVGKTSAARILAKAANCEQPDVRQRPCGSCAACTAVSEGRAVDVIEMDAASHTSVDDAREIIERVQFRPAAFRTKVYIIDEVHMLSTAAFNALLKTLEEPPDHAMFILATTEFHKVPATITSRCQRFVFNRHTVQDTAAHLEWIAEQEQLQLDPGVGEAIARAATGSMRDAVSILDQLLGYGERSVSLERVRGLLGATAAEEVHLLVAALADQDVARALHVINAVANQGADLRQFTRDVVTYLRNLMLLKANGDPTLIDVGSDDLRQMQANAEALDLGALLAWLKIFSGLDYQLRTSPYGQLPLEMAVVEALVVPAPAAEATPRPTPARRQAPAAPTAAAAPRRAAEAPLPAPQPAAEPAQAAPALQAAEPAPEPAQPASGAAADPPAEPRRKPATLPAEEMQLAEIEAVWDQFIDDLKPYDPRVQAVLRSCDPVMIEDSMLVIGAPTPFHHRKLEDISSRQTIEMVLEKILGRAIPVRAELISQEQQSRARDARRQREEVMKDQIVKAARNIFDARIVGVQEPE